jgi:ATP-dependent helicase/nuclease subunit A
VEAVLTAHRIPVYSDAGGNALGGEECISAVQHLLLLDNMRNDLALIAELRSPLFQWSEQELAAVRLNMPQREASFYEALTHTAQDQPETVLGRRCAAVLESLEEERFLYRNMQPSEYLWDFLMRSGMYAHYGAQPGGKMRQANLRMLCLRAGEYFAQHQEGMSGFLETVQEKLGGEETSPTIVNPWENVVRLMTIHKSKGLEFPTVYVMGMGNPLSRRANMKQLKMHGRLGIAPEYRNETRRTKRTTLLQSGIQLCERNEERAEKARVLYVAMTRPKNRLVMIGSYKGKKNGLESILENVTEKMVPDKDLAAVDDAISYLDWLTLALHPEDEYTVTEGKNFSTYAPWKTFSEELFQNNSTGFPQKSAIWRVFFHIGSDKSELSEDLSEEQTPNSTEELWREVVTYPGRKRKAIPFPICPSTCISR